MDDDAAVEDFFDGMEMSSPAPGVIVTNHAPSRCEGAPCCIHNPSDHHMRGWPTRFGQARLIGDTVFVLTLRLCKHGWTHPDRDSLAYAETLDNGFGVWAAGVHECDMCCHKEIAERL